jgi:hypothetical protein
LQITKGPTSSAAGSEVGNASTEHPESWAGTQDTAPVVKDALTAIGVAALIAGAYRLMSILGELISFSGAMGQ